MVSMRGSLVVGAVAAATARNMNGLYQVNSGGGVTNTKFNSDYASKGHEYFDVYAPEIATHYGEVFWTNQGNLPLPAEIVARFKGKTIAITGYEHDQVMVDPVGKPGVNPDRDVSVPFTWAYNHHYMMWATADGYSELVPVTPDPADTRCHGGPCDLDVVELPAASERASVP